MKLPVILAGPILRRTTEQNVYIWMATSEELVIDGEVFEVSGDQPDVPSYRKISDRSKTTMLQFGENLYIYLIKLEPLLNTFPTEQPLAYNLTFHSKFKTFDFLSPDEFQAQTITYENHQYPTFIINHKDHQFLYGSCRKAHGEGEDLFAGADLYVKEHYHNIETRPSQLFLLGDQIYSDDVADPLFAVIQHLAQALMGKHEQNMMELDDRLQKEPFQEALHQIHGRQYISEKFCKFTSNNAYNHLFTFGEYAAMYLLTWNPELLKAIPFPAFEEMNENNRLYYIFKDEYENEEERIKELEDHELRYHKQLEKLQAFQNQIPCARRVMANTPTYMIFDDHDVTDDWNLSENWTKLVSESPLGSFVVANGLTAYFAFQGWGNDPILFPGEFIDCIQSYFQALKDQIPLKNEPIYKKWLKEMWEFDSWFYTVPSNPNTLVLDTRTMRHFGTSPQPVKIGRKIEETPNSPELISKEGWEKITKLLLNSSWNKDEPLIIISPVPLYGIDLIETVLLEYVDPLRSFGIPVHYQFDMEAWKYNIKGYYHFIQNLEKWGGKHYFILSGDTHLASNAKANITIPHKRKFTIHQFTSSPIKNMSFSGFFGRLLKTAIWFNALKRKKKVFHRSINQDYSLVESKQELTNRKGVRWKEILQYMSTDSGSVVETNNNIGLVTIKHGSINNTLLTYDGKNVKEQSFSSNPIL